MKHTVYLSLGTNLGDRLQNLSLALSNLPPMVELASASPIYETLPWGYTDQPSFLNQVIEARTELAPTELLAFLKQLESQLGRKPSIRYGPRLIDLDILFYAGLVMETPALTIPHPRLTERAFVLVPLADLAPELVHPITGKTIKQLAQEIDRTGVNPYRSG